jgi:hypothetical protein
LTSSNALEALRFGGFFVLFDANGAVDDHPPPAENEYVTYVTYVTYLTYLARGATLVLGRGGSP